jgi:hypothetical protein
MTTHGTGRNRQLRPDDLASRAYNRTLVPRRDAMPDHGALIRDVADRFYGGPCDAEWVPSDEADVFRLHWPDGRASRILKIQRPEMSWVVWREQALLPALRARGLTEVPLVEHTQEDLPGCAATFMTMPMSPSVRLDEVFAAHPDRAADLVERLGGFLRRLGAQPLAGMPRISSPEDNDHGRAWMGSVDVLLAHPWARDEPLTRLLRQTAEVLGSLPGCFGIGGHGIGLLYDGTREFTVVDWAGAGPVWPMYDLASAIGLLEVFGPRATTTLIPPLLAGYRPGGRLSGAELHELRMLLLIWVWFASGLAVQAGSREHFDRAIGEIDDIGALIEICSG